MKIKLILVPIILILSMTKAYCDPPEGYNFVGYDEGIRLAKASDKNIFLYYGRYGCGFCDKTNKESFSDPAVAEAYKKNYVLIYVDAEGTQRLTLPSGETITEQQFGARLKSLVTPYFMMLDKTGAPLEKIPGFKTKKQLLMFDEYISKGKYKEMSFANYLQ